MPALRGARHVFRGDGHAAAPCLELLFMPERARAFILLFSPSFYDDDAAAHCYDMPRFFCRLFFSRRVFI